VQNNAPKQQQTHAQCSCTACAAALRQELAPRTVKPVTEESWNLERFNTDKFSDDGGSYTALVAQEVACPGPFPIVPSLSNFPEKCKESSCQGRK